MYAGLSKLIVEFQESEKTPGLSGCFFVSMVIYSLHLIEQRELKMRNISGQDGTGNVIGGDSSGTGISCTPGDSDGSQVGMDQAAKWIMASMPGAGEGTGLNGAGEGSGG